MSSPEATHIIVEWLVDQYSRIFGHIDKAEAAFLEESAGKSDRALFDACSAVFGMSVQLTLLGAMKHCCDSIEWEEENGPLVNEFIGISYAEQINMVNDHLEAADRFLRFIETYTPENFETAKEYYERTKVAAEKIKSKLEALIQEDDERHKVTK